MNFAVIQNNKVIAIIGLFPTNYNQFQDIIPVNTNVQIGDDYIDGNFYRNEKLILSPEEEQILKL